MKSAQSSQRKKEDGKGGSEISRREFLATAGSSLMVGPIGDSLLTGSPGNGASSSSSGQTVPIRVEWGCEGRKGFTPVGLVARQGQMVQPFRKTGEGVASASCTPPSEGPAVLAVSLGPISDYGFLFTTEQLQREGFLWLADLGIFISDGRSFQATAPLLHQRRQAALAATEFQDNYVKFRKQGWHEYRSLNPKGKESWDAWADPFIREHDLRTTIEPRVIDWYGRRPEASYEEVCQEVTNAHHQLIHLGWAFNSQEITVESTGHIYYFPITVRGTGWRPGPGMTFRFGFGDPPVFERKRTEITQTIEGNCLPIVKTCWHEGTVRVEQTAFGYQLENREATLGGEPLVAMVRMTMRNLHAEAQDVRMTLQMERSESSGGALPDEEELVKKAVGDGQVQLRDDLITSNNYIYVRSNRPMRPSGAKQEGGGAALPHGLVLGVPELETEAGGGKTHLWNFVLFEGRLSPGQVEECVVMLPSFGLPLEQAARLRDLDFDTTRCETIAFWQRQQGQGAQIEVPEPALNELWKIAIPNMFITTDRDTDGLYVAMGGPSFYGRTWGHITLLSILQLLVRRGMYDLAQKHLETQLRWQGSSAQVKMNTDDFKGFFGSSARYNPGVVWVSQHGWVLRTISELYLVSRDAQWLERILTPTLEACDWIIRQRKRTKVMDSDGKPVSYYGLLPSGVATDSQVKNFYFMSDAHTWIGLDTARRMLEEINHPRAAEIAAETRDYRQCIFQALRRATAERPAYRLNDGTYVPYVPSKVQGEGRDFDYWYPGRVDCGAWHLFEGVMDCHEPEADWLLNDAEDNLLFFGPRMSSEPCYSPHVTAHFKRDDVPNAIHAFYCLIVSGTERNTHAWLEMRCELQETAGPWYGLPSSDGEFSKYLRWMLVREDGNELKLCQVTPRAWLQHGKNIRVRDLPTDWGEMHLEAHSRTEEGRIEVSLSPPKRNGYERITLRLRHPEKKRMQKVTVNGNAWTQFDAEREEIALVPRHDAQVVAWY